MIAHRPKHKLPFEIDHSKAIRSLSLQVLCNLIHEPSILDTLVESEQFAKFERTSFWSVDTVLLPYLPAFFASVCWRNTAARERFSRQGIVDAMATQFVSLSTDISEGVHIVRFLLLFSGRSAKSAAGPCGDRECVGVGRWASGEMGVLQLSHVVMLAYGWLCLMFVLLLLVILIIL
jgi:hypothetical protein